MKNKYLYICLSVLVTSFLVGINLKNSSISTDKKFVYTNENNKMLLDSVITDTCPGASSCCETGYNVMCHMVDPIKNYYVTAQVCDNRSGNYHKGIDLTTSGDEFKQNGVFSNDLFMNYKLDKMKKVTDTVEYNITFNVTKDDKGNYKVNDLSNSDLEKIHGVYNYDND